MKKGAGRGRRYRFDSCRGHCPCPVEQNGFKTLVCFILT